MAEVPHEKRHRATRRDVRLDREVSAVVRAVRSRINTWQVRAAYLNAVAARRAADGEAMDRFEREANDLAIEVEVQRQQVDEQAATLPDAVRNHSSFQDIVRALETVARALEEAQARFRPTHRQ